MSEDHGGPQAEVPGLFPLIAGETGVLHITRGRDHLTQRFSEDRILLCGDAEGAQVE